MTGASPPIVGRKSPPRRSAWQAVCITSQERLRLVQESFSGSASSRIVQPYRSGRPKFYQITNRGKELPAEAAEFSEFLKNAHRRVAKDDTPSLLESKCVGRVHCRRAAGGNERCG